MSTPETTSKKGSVPDSSCRLRSLPKNSMYHQVPDCGELQRLVEVWYEMGQSKVGFSGEVPLDWVDVANYSQSNYLTHRERVLVIKMSTSYINSIHKGKKRGMRAPFCNDYELAEQQIIDQEISNSQKQVRRDDKVAQFIKDNNM